MKFKRFGSDVTRAILKCEGKGGVQYGTLQPQSLEKLKNLEKGIIKENQKESFTFLFVHDFLVLCLFLRFFHTSKFQLF